MIQHSTYPRVLADIGGTHARFILETAPGQRVALKIYASQTLDNLTEAIRQYLQEPEVSRHVPQAIKHAAIAIANPVEGDWVSMTNAALRFSIQETKQNLAWETLLVFNDFAALALALPELPSEACLPCGGGQAHKDRAKGLLGAGTGLGVSGLIPDAQGTWVPVQGEGGHVTLAATNAREDWLIQQAKKQFTHISAERFLSGSGLELMYQLLAQAQKKEPGTRAASEISALALAGQCSVCDEVVELFCGFLGTVAGNLALTLGAKGGIYIGGGIVPRLGQRFINSGFRARFEAKGRFQPYLADIPVWVITDPYATFSGVSTLLSKHLEARTR